MSRQYIKDIFSLCKPRITMMSTLMSWGGLILARTNASFELQIWTLLGSALIVASANSLNMHWERETDKLMNRTARRPLPAGRLGASVALTVGIVLGVISIFILYLKVNLLTAILALFALVLYVYVYTPLKYKTPYALMIGAIPGAMPPLLGWTAATNEITIAGLVLFFILFIWQLPHFLAIAILRKEEYENAGIIIFPLVTTEKNVKLQALIYALLLIPVSFLLVPLGTLGWLYGVSSLIAGFWFSFEAYKGLSFSRPEEMKKLYIKSIIYLPILIFGIVLDILLV